MMMGGPYTYALTSSNIHLFFSLPLASSPALHPSRRSAPMLSVTIESKLKAICPVVRDGLPRGSIAAGSKLGAMLRQTPPLHDTASPREMGLVSVSPIAFSAVRREKGGKTRQTLIMTPAHARLDWTGPDQSARVGPHIS